MAQEKLRQQIAWEAARLLYRREESEYFRARLKAARLVSKDPVEPRDMPTRRDIREQIEVMADRVRDAGGDPGAFPPPDVFDFGAPRHREPPELTDRFAVYRSLLLPLERVMQRPHSHPEGDALYHSLQVFELAREELPYDEEFLLAALLHDVGKGLDPQDHIGAALEALDGHITPRTAWLIEHHTEAGALRDGTLGARSRRRLSESESFEELMLLAKCDHNGRQVGVAVADTDDGLDYLRELAESCGE